MVSWDVARRLEATPWKVTYGVGAVNQRWTCVYLGSRGQQLISMGDHGQRPSQSMTGTALEHKLRTSGGPFFSETGCFSSKMSSTIGLLPVAIQFSAFFSPQYTCTSLLLPSFFPRASSLLGPDVHWKDIGW